tara:strand:- start:142 stop:444 length:303 start_codon:yes stop_codon:yes gene_type:complete
MLSNYQMIKSFPRLSTLAPTDPTYIKVKRGSTKDALLATIYQLQADKDHLNIRLATAIKSANRQQIEGWSGVIAKFRQQVGQDVKSFTKETAQDIRSMLA